TTAARRRTASACDVITNSRQHRRTMAMNEERYVWIAERVDTDGCAKFWGAYSSVEKAKAFLSKLESEYNSESDPLTWEQSPNGDDYFFAEGSYGIRYDVYKSLIDSDGG